MSGLTALLMLAMPASGSVCALDGQGGANDEIMVTAPGETSASAPETARPVPAPASPAGEMRGTAMARAERRAQGKSIQDIIVSSKSGKSARKRGLRKPPSKPAGLGRDTSYRVKPGDLLEISIWKEPDMRREMLVLPDGTISYPLAGHVQVVGMTPKEIEDVLARRLSGYFKNPFLNVIVKQATGNQIFVLGEVRNPGAFTITQPIDVMQALSLAGGLSEFADKSEIIVLRRQGNGEQKVISFKYSSVQKGRNLGTNVTLLSGDTVVVPERGLF